MRFRPVSYTHLDVYKRQGHDQPADGDHRDGHDGEALADDQCDQGHVDDVRHVVDEVVQLGEERCV